MSHRTRLKRPQTIPIQSALARVRSLQIPLEFTALVPEPEFGEQHPVAESQESMAKQAEQMGSMGSEGSVPRRALGFAANRVQSPFKASRRAAEPASGANPPLVQRSAAIHLQPAEVDNSARLWVSLLKPVAETSERLPLAPTQRFCLGQQRLHRLPHRAMPTKLEK